MTPARIGLLFFTMATLLIAWIKGGHPERLGACAILFWMATTIAAPAWLHQATLARVPVFEMTLAAVLLAVFFRMAMKGGRWWPFAASAVVSLNVLGYLALVLVPEFDRRVEISAHAGLAAALNLTLLAGIGERWLAGERPVSAGRWRSRTATP